MVKVKKIMRHVAGGRGKKMGKEGFLEELTFEQMFEGRVEFCLAKRVGRAKQQMNKSEKPTGVC